MVLDISFIIPVYNRPDEIKELLQSFSELEGNHHYEIVLVEDGSTISSKVVVDTFKDRLNIAYYSKPNSGPGDSRNFGMKRAKGNYFLILDSDCLLPPHYLNEIMSELHRNYVDCFGGPDAAHKSFSTIQKAINFSMTSFITTGGIRGKKRSVTKFQPRSFNMGISKEAFEASGGFGMIHPGEDPDLSIRLEQLGFKTKLIPNAYVYHKRRISWSKFSKQVYKFGMVRPILNKWHPQTKKLAYWMPSLFCIGLLVSLLIWMLGNMLLLKIYALYFIISFLVAMVSTKDILVSFLVIPAILIQFLGYGFGFLRSTILLSATNKPETELFPQLFFKPMK